MTKMSPKQKFVDGEKVLCFHGPLIYEAKALKSTITKDKQVKYYIHYAGWNKNWDEWVPENRVLKYNEANVQRQKEVFRLHNVNNAGKIKKGAPKGRKSDALASAAATTKESGASSGGSESRASTPSKEGLNNSTATSTTRGNRSKLAEAVSKRDDKDNDATNKDSEREEPIPKKKRGAAAAANSTEKSERGVAAAAGNNMTTGVPNTATGSSSSASSISSTTSSVNNSTAQAEIIEDDNLLRKVDAKIKIPDELKQCLVDDWDAVTRQHKLLDIPSKYTVQDIADQYVQSKKSLKASSISKESSVVDMVNGVVEYFNVMLGSQLLYKFERPQYAEILQRYPDTPLSKLYGGFHLLRLFVKLGSKLGYTTLDEKGMQTVLTNIHDFLRFLVKNNGSYFSMSNFINVSPEYHRHTQ